MFNMFIFAKVRHSNSLQILIHPHWDFTKKKRNSMEVAQFLSNIGLKDLIQTFQGK
jgi:hypothetical protein